MARVAVQQSLNNVKNTLQSNQFDVVDWDPGQQSSISDVSCYVISGQDKDVMGIAGIQVDIPIINADGMTQKEVLEQVQQRVSLVNAANK
jgi:hypothetical protein